MKQFPVKIKQVLDAPDIAPLQVKPYFAHQTFRHVILVILDGTSYDVLAKANTPFITRLKSRGTEFTKCRTSFPTITGSAHTTMNTGAYPESHGYGLPWTLRNGERVPATSRADFRGYVSESLRPAGMSTASIADSTMKGAMCYLSVEFFGHSIEAGGELARWTFERFLPSLLSVTFYAPDSLNHLYGPGNKHTLLSLEHIDQELHRLAATVDRLGLLEETVFIIASDHGHADSSRSVNEVFIPYMEDGQIVIPNLRAVALHNPPDKMLADLALREEIECILSPMELALLGYGALDSEYVACLKPGYSWHGEGAPNLGNHGGVTMDERHVPLIVSSPSFKAGRVDKIVDTVDIAPTITALLGAKYLDTYQGRVLSEVVSLDTESTPAGQELAILRAERESILDLIRQGEKVAKDRLQGLINQRRRLERANQAAYVK
ncbi:MAG: sulfatase-like hydrolase/transferase [Firmicutes bacterium]|nr:sulfatase-like hydrolase/transferase [Bacillota bacterium]